MKRVRLWLLALALALAVGVGLLLQRGLQSVHEAQALQHEIVAERVFDELESELSAFITREEARPFLHWRFLYLPEGQVGANAYARSPLSGVPEEPWIVGYFQLDPDGSFSTPLEPRNPELAEESGWTATSDLEALARQLEVLTRDVERPDPPPERPVAKEKLAPKPVAKLASKKEALEEDPKGLLAKKADNYKDAILSRGAQKRAERVDQKLTLGSANVATFQSKEIAPWEGEPQQQAVQTADGRLDELVEPPRLDAERDIAQAADPEPPGDDPWDGVAWLDEAALAGADGPAEANPPPVDAVVEAVIDVPPSPPPQQVVPAPVPADTDPVVDVAISPLRGELVVDDHLVLVRTVRVGEASHHQGLVLSLSELTRHLEREILGGPVAPDVSVDWSLEGRPQGQSSPVDYRFEHAFAEPFTALGATAGLGTIGASPAGERALLGLAALLGVVTLLGFVAVHRSVWVVVDFARRRNDFVAAVSHELKTPLTSIRMYAEMLRDGMVPEDRRATYYATMASEGERLSRLIGNVLELSRLERDDRPVVLEAGHPAGVLDELIRILGPHARAQGLELRVEVDDDLPPALFDHDALLQVLLNLVDNAIKFGRDGESAEVTVRCTREGEQIVLAVRDHGPGVPPKQLERIFQPFFRGERELTRTTKGTGIGLALVHGLVERMQGQVRAENHAGGGLRVEVRLPAAA